MFARLCAFLTVLLLSACASYPPLPGDAFTEAVPAPDNAARIYVYRPSYLQLMYAKTGIFVDDEPRAVLTNDSYREFTLAPGRHQFMARLVNEKLADEHEFLREPIAFEYDVEAGQTYYLAWRPVNRTIGDGYYLAGVMLDPSLAVSNHAGAGNVSIRTGATLGVVAGDTGLAEIAKTGISRAQ